MADNELKRLLAGLLSDIPTEVDPGEAVPEAEVTGEASMAPGTPEEWKRHAIHLQTAAQISHAASSILDLDELLPQAVDLIRQQFGFYYVGIFLMDEARKWAVLRAGTGEAGRQMMAQGHRLEVGGDSMVGWCIARRRARIALDVGEEAVHFDNPFLPETRSEMALPLISRGRVIGAMTIQSVLPAAFSEEDVTVLQTMADQLANAVENARLYAEATQRSAELSALLEVSTATSSTLDLEEVLAITAEQIAQATASDGCTLSRWDPGEDVVTTWIEVRLDDKDVDPPGTTYALAEYPTTRSVLESHEPVDILVTDPDADAAEVALMRAQHISGLLMLPLLAGRRVIGLVEVQRSKHARPFTPEEIRLCQALAQHAADAIQDAQFFQQRERRITQLAIVNEIAQAVSSSLDLDGMLETVYQQVSRLFDTTNFYIATYKEGSEQWTSVFHIEGGRRRPVAQHSVEAGLTGYIIRNREPLLFRTAEENLAFKHRSGVDVIGEMARSWLGVPLISADKLVGVMAIQNYEREHLYDEQDLRLFSTIAAQVANALENLRLLEETRRRAREMEVINEVGQAVTSVLDLDSVLRQIVDITKARFGHYFVSIELVEDDWIIFRHGSTIGDSNRRLTSELPPIQRQRGSGLVAEAVRTAQPVLVHDVLEDPRYLAVTELPETRSELSVPITVKGRLIGVLNVQSERPGAYGRSDVALLQSLASQAGVAIENARLFQEREQRITELAIVNEIGRAVSLSPDLEELLETVYDRISRLFETESFYVAVHQESSDEWMVALEMERGERQPQSRHEVSSGLTGYIIRNRRPLLLRDIAEFTAFHEKEGIEILGDRACTWLGVPLIAADQVVGVLGVQDYERENAYDDQDMAFLSTIGAQVANALGNVRLLDETRRRAEEMSILHSLSLEMAQEQQDIDTLLQTITRRAMELLGTDGGGIWLWHKDAEELELVITYQVGDIDFTGRRLKSGEGLSGRAFARRQIQVVENYLDWEGHSAAFTDAAFAAAMSVPMIWQTQSVGVLVLTRSQAGRPFSKQEQNLARLLSSQAAVALQNARLFEETRSRAEEVMVLNEMGRSLTSRLDIESVIHDLYRYASHLMDTTNFYVALYDPETDRVNFPLAVEDGQQTSYRSRKRGKGLTEHLLDSREALLIGQDVRSYMMEHLEGVEHIGREAQSWLGVPIAVGDRTLGALVVQSYTAPWQYNERHREILTAMARQAAVSIENVQLLTRAQQSAQRAQALYETSRALSSYLEEEPLMRTILEAIYRTMDCEFATISIVDERAQIIEARHILWHGEFDVFPEWLEMVRYPLDHPDITADVYRSGRTEIIGEWDPRFNREIWEKFDHQRLLRIFMPVKLRDRVMGVIEVGYDKEAKANIAEQEVQLLAAFVDQAASALQIVRQLETTQFRARHEQVLREITTRVRASTDPEAIMRAAVRELGTALGRPAFVRLGSAQQLARDDGNGQDQDAAQRGGE